MLNFSYYIPNFCEEVGVDWKSGTFRSSDWKEQVTDSLIMHRKLPDRDFGGPFSSPLQNHHRLIISIYYHYLIPNYGEKPKFSLILLSRYKCL